MTSQISRLVAKALPLAIASCLSLQPAAANDDISRVPVPRTGQTETYDASGLKRDDGGLRKGVAWPKPRFRDTGKGTVKDRLTGLIWLKNANCAGDIANWQGALDWVAELNANGSMNSQQCGDFSKGKGAAATHQTDWRLPNVRELLSLIDYGTVGPPLAAGHPFISFEWSNYWSSTSDADFPNDFAWNVGFYTGGSDSHEKNNELFFVTAVRGGP